MKEIALLALLVVGFVQTLDLNIEDEDLQLLKYIGLNADPTSEEFQYSLKSKSVPLVLNPNKHVEPPKFAVAILRNATLVGSGAIIAKHFVVTVCSLLIPKGNAKINLTALTKVQYPSFNSPNDDMDLRTPVISKLIPHPECVDYNRINPVTNIGLIQTIEPMDESDSVKYPKFPTIHIPEEKGKFILSNFRVNNPFALNLKEAIWYVFTKPSPNSLCKELFHSDKQKFDPKGNICMSYIHIGDGDYCRGDIGAPLSMRVHNEDILIGLNIHKHQCGQPREVAAFVCINTNKEWIESTLSQINRP